MADLRAELEDLDMEADDGGGGFVPLRDDAVQCFKEHTGKAGTMHCLDSCSTCVILCRLCIFYIPSSLGRACMQWRGG